MLLLLLRVINLCVCVCVCVNEPPLIIIPFTECSLADYVSGIQSEKVPFVFLPAQGQLINPNAEIALSGTIKTHVESSVVEGNIDLYFFPLLFFVDVRAEGEIVVAPVCIVSKAHFLTRSGWTPTDNSSSAGLDVELPFALARESSRTHLQVQLITVDY